MRIGEQCPYITPCGFCSRQMKQCDFSYKKKDPPLILKKAMNIPNDFEHAIKTMQEVEE